MSDTRESIVQTILDNVDLVELINEVTPLQKKGKNHFGLCPFHHEKTPSFSVNEEKKLYHCFSCKASGNALTFVKETKQMTSSEAIRYLADRANITLDSPIKDDPNEKYYTINQTAADFYHDVLHHTKEGVTALQYLNQRGFKTETLKYFNLGLAPKKRDALYQTLLQKDYLLSDMVDLGLAQESETVYDVFYQRIMFPIHNADHHVVGFSGRVYDKIDKHTAKYINSTTTPVFEKSTVLYNLNRAKQVIKKHDRVVLFEGFMDVMRAYQAGITEGLAIMGTSLTEQHIAMLKRLTRRVILCFDGDSAGQEATKKFMRVLEDAKFEVSVAELSDKQDPDDYIQKYGDKAFIKLIDDATPSLAFHYAQALKSINKDKITDIETFKNAIFKRIASLTSVEQEHYLKKMSEDLNASLDVLWQDFKSVRKKSLPEFKKIPKVAITNRFVKAERGFIRYFVKDESFVRRFRYHFEDALFNDKHARDIELEIFEYYDFNKQSCIVPELFKGHLNEAQQAYFDKYVLDENLPYDENEFEDFISVMQQQLIQNRINALRKRLQESSDTSEKIHLKKQIDQLNKEAKHGKRKNYSRAH